MQMEQREAAEGAAADAERTAGEATAQREAAETAAAEAKRLAERESAKRVEAEEASSAAAAKFTMQITRLESQISSLRALVEREELANAALVKKHSTEIAELNAAAKEASVDYRTEQSRLILAHSTEQALKEKRADALKAEIVKLEAVVATRARHHVGSRRVTTTRTPTRTRASDPEEEKDARADSAIGGGSTTVAKRWWWRAGPRAFGQRREPRRCAGEGGAPALTKPALRSAAEGAVDSAPSAASSSSTTVCTRRASRSRGRARGSTPRSRRRWCRRKPSRRGVSTVATRRFARTSPPPRGAAEISPPARARALSNTGTSR